MLCVSSCPHTHTHAHQSSRKKGALTFVDEKKKLEAAKDACRSPVNAQSRMECRYMPHQPARSSRRTGVAAAWREEDFDLWEKKGGSERSFKKADRQFRE